MGIRVFALALALAMPSSVRATVAVPDVPPPDQVMAIPTELLAQFRQQVVSKGGSEPLRLQRMVDFLFQEEGLGMEYRHDATYTVEQAYLTRTANCLTFTLMSVALAREAGLKAYGQEMNDILSWRQEGNFIYQSDHVNAGVEVQQGRRRLTVDVASDSVIAREPPRSISDDRLLAHYYNNRAAELLGDKEPAAAMPYMAMSLRLDDRYATGWSNSGVLHLHGGEREVAERHYRRALALNPTHPSALVNLATLYKRIGNHAQAAALRQRLERAQLKDPFHLFVLAMEHESKGEYLPALKLYQRAIRLHGDEHRFHFGLARIHLKLGDARRAGKALARAHALSDGDAENLYHAKLDRLQALSR